MSVFRNLGNDQISFSEKRKQLWFFLKLSTRISCCSPGVFHPLSGNRKFSNIRIQIQYVKTLISPRPTLSSAPRSQVRSVLGEKIPLCHSQSHPEPYERFFTRSYACIQRLEITHNPKNVCKKIMAMLMCCTLGACGRHRRQEWETAAAHVDWNENAVNE